jgi:aminobutyraldehyde dehydrogenase
MQHNLLINGELVAGEGEMVPVFNPANGEVILEIAEATEARSTRRLRQRIGPLSAGARRRRKLARTLLKLAEAITDHAEALAKLESLNCGKPLHCVMNDELPAVADVFRFFAGAARCLPGMAAGNIWRAHLDDSPGSGWRGGLYRTVELSVNDGGVEAGAGAGSRQLRGHQTVRDYAADGAEAG